MNCQMYHWTACKESVSTDKAYHLYKHNTWFGYSREDIIALGHTTLVGKGVFVDFVVVNLTLDDFLSVDVVGINLVFERLTI